MSPVGLIIVVVLFPEQPLTDLLIQKLKNWSHEVCNNGCSSVVPVVGAFLLPRGLANNNLRKLRLSKLGNRNRRYQQSILRLEQSDRRDHRGKFFLSSHSGYPRRLD